MAMCMYHLVFKAFIGSLPAGGFHSLLHNKPSLLETIIYHFHPTDTGVLSKN